MFISKITIYSHRIREMKDFYVRLLGFSPLRITEDNFEIKVGESIMEVRQSLHGDFPYYHFAFNIPVNRFKEAKEWIKTRVELNIEENMDEIYFTGSKARSLYFYDPAGNVVELIARENMTTSTAAFTARSILNISEINITVENVLTTGNDLLNFGIPVRDNKELTENALNFMGEKEDGAFLLLGPLKRRWIFSNKTAENYPLIVEINNLKQILVKDTGKLQYNFLSSKGPERWML